MVRAIALIPFVCSIIAFVLSVLTVTAGSKNGFLESYSIMTFNVSDIGTAVLQTKAATTAAPIAMPTISVPAPGSSTTNPLESAWSFLTGSVQNISTTLENGINKTAAALTSEIEHLVSAAIDSVGNKTIKALKQDVGLKDYYAIHLTSICDGMYMADGTENGTCNSATAGNTHIDVATPLSKAANATAPLSAIGINLAGAINPEAFQSTVDGLTSIITAVVALFIVAAVAAGLTIFTSILVFLTPPKKRFIGAGLSTASLAMTLQFAGSIATTVAVKKLSEIGNGLGNGLGLYITYSTKFLAITWTATAFMIIATAVFTLDLAQHYRFIIEPRNNKVYVDSMHKGSESTEHFGEKRSSSAAPYPVGGNDTGIVYPPTPRAPIAPYTPDLTAQRKTTTYQNPRPFPPLEMESPVTGPAYLHNEKKDRYPENGTYQTNATGTFVNEGQGSGAYNSVGEWVENARAGGLPPSPRLYTGYSNGGGGLRTVVPQRLGNEV